MYTQEKARKPVCNVVISCVFFVGMFDVIGKAAQKLIWEANRVYNNNYLKRKRLEDVRIVGSTQVRMVGGRVVRGLTDKNVKRLTLSCKRMKDCN